MIHRRPIIVSIVSVLLSGTALPVFADVVFYRMPGHVFDNNGTPATDDENQEAPASIALTVPSAFGLTSGVAVDLPLSGSVAGAAYRFANAVPGLVVDTADGRVTGTPTSAPGQEVSLTVEAVRNGTVVAATPALVRTVRAPITIDVVPSGLGTLVSGQDLPSVGVVAGAQGGQPTTYAWSLTNAPSWLGIAPSGNGSAKLSIVSGKTRALPSTQIGVKVVDAEGRASIVSNFTMQVAQGPAKLMASDATASAMFGWSGAISPDNSTVHVGQYGKAGVYAYSLTEGEWNQTRRVLPPSGDVAATFGSAVSVSDDGNRMLVGAYNAKGTGTVATGVVYAYELVGGEWVFTQRIPAPGGVDGDYFGYAVSMSGDGSTAIVTSRRKNLGQGAVYVFRYSGGTWTQQGTALVGPGVPSVGYFGTATAISTDGNTFVAGADQVDGTLQWEGRAFVYRYASGAWTSVTIKAPAPTLRQRFGLAVDISGDGAKVLVGSTTAAYSFTKPSSTWTASTMPVPSGYATGFGWAVSIAKNGGRAAVGTYNGLGAAHVYSPSGTSWVVAKTLTAPDVATTDGFGYGLLDLSPDGSKLLAGAYSHDAAAADAGAAYVFETQ